MKLIAHRANTIGPNPALENHPDYIDAAIKQGYDVEIDLRLIGDQLFLGHDTPQYLISINYLLDRLKFLWIHTKNYEAFDHLFHNYPQLNFFWHSTEDFILTSQKIIWMYPKKRPLLKGSICVLPELADYSKEELSICSGLCSDYVEQFK